jgi:hypothetical protein
MEREGIERTREDSLPHVIISKAFYNSVRKLKKFTVVLAPFQGPTSTQRSCHSASVTPQVFN